MRNQYIFQNVNAFRRCSTINVGEKSLKLSKIGFKGYFSTLKCSQSTKQNSLLLSEYYDLSMLDLHNPKMLSQKIMAKSKMNGTKIKLNSKKRAKIQPV